FRRERSLADAGAVRLDDANHAVEGSTGNTGAAPNAVRRTVRAGHVRIGAVVHIEQASLGGLEEDTPSVADRLVQQAGRVSHERPERLAVTHVLVADGVRVEVLGRVGEAV